MPYNVMFNAVPMNIGPRLWRQSVANVCNEIYLRHLSRTFCHCQILFPVNNEPKETIDGSWKKGGRKCRQFPDPWASLILEVGI